MSTSEAVRYYLRNAVNYPLERESKSFLYDWVESNSTMIFGRNVTGEWEEETGGFRRGPFRNRKRDEDEEGEKEERLPRSLETVSMWLGETPENKPVSCTAEAIMEAFHLDEEFHELITFWCLCIEIPELARLAYPHRFGDSNDIIPSLLGLSKKDYEQMFIANNPLWRKGLIGGGIHMRNEIYDKPCPMITDMVTANIKSAEGVRTFILGDPLEAKLKRSDFEHVKGYETLSRLLGSVSQKKSLGVNFLIYGPAGTGKTEMSKTICSDLNLKLYGVSSRGRERDPEERRRDLARSLALIEGTENGALLVDECEDLWGGGGFHFQLFGLERSEPQKNGGKSKLFFHRLMETATVPVIWVCNQTQNVDKAHLRRFRYAVEMEKLSKETRMAIWNRCAENLNLHLPEERIKSLSEKYDIPPALMETAMANASDLGDDTIIEESLDSILSAMGQKVPNQCKESKKLPFAPELLNTSENLERLADSLVSKGIHRISLLLYGVSGSGKSAYAGYLAERLGIPFICKKASDILGPYVGQTEMNIAQTFQEARETKSLLCLDECDSWLRDRRSARQSWEIQAVNEMLTQMETFEGPFVCTTNLYEEIDPAAYRRFLRKVKYEFLESEQVEAAFRYFFGLEIPKPYNDLTALSPGDFVNVKKAATIYDITDPKELAELLRNEQNAKIQIESKRIGFAC